jgi:hypothetical protein
VIVASTSLLRFLELVQKELGACDARLEIGGRDPQDERFVWCALGELGRLVAVFDEVPEGRAVLREKLRVLAQTFSDLATPPLPDAPMARIAAEIAQRRLDEALHDITERVGAVGCVVIDAQSPMVWGNSQGEAGDRDLEAAIFMARRAEREAPENPDARMLIARAIREVRRADQRSREPSSLRLTVQAEPLGFLARSFAGLYRLVMVFRGHFSELHAEAAVLHSLAHIERLVLALPPVDPPPGKARVVELPLRR